jgi:hypothetical protein
MDSMRSVRLRDRLEASLVSAADASLDGLSKGHLAALLAAEPGVEQDVTP